MKVRTSLFLLSAIFVIVIAALGYVMFHSSNLVNSEVRESESATRIIKDIFELNIVTYEYLSHYEERMHQQWQLKYDSLGEFLEVMRKEEIHPEHLSRLESITSDYESLGDYFSLIVANFTKRKRLIEENKPQAEIDLSLDSEKRLSTQALMRSQRMASEAFEFSVLMQQRIAQVQQRTNSIALVSIIGFVVLSFCISFLTTRAIIEPLNELVRSAEIIGKGNLKHRVDSKTRNEIGELALAFNQMTERRQQAEEKLKEYSEQLEETVEDLERSNIELEQFAYVASHDLQEPLRMVSSYMQLLEKRYRGRLDDDADEFIAFAVDGAKRLQTLIKDLLAFSRVKSRGRSFDSTDSQWIIERVLTNLGELIKENNATVTHDRLPTVMADDVQLEQVFQNLLGNAIKFHSEVPPEIHIGAERMDGEWKFSVRDNGIGIEPEYREKIFVIFKRLHGGEEYPGTGIGLAISKRIIERHGGRIWVETTPGGGSTFFFTLPVREE
jgi:signal transduction histidine kinase